MKLWAETFLGIARIAPGEHLRILLQDVRYGVRKLGKNPGFTLMAVLTLALGIGANTAIFSFVNGILLRPLPYPEPGRVLSVFTTYLPRGVPRDIFSPRNFFDLEEQNDSFEAMGTHYGAGFDLTDSGEPIIVPAQRVTSGFFPALGVQPLLGRTFLPEEDRETSANSVVLEYGLWQDRYGGDKQIIGKSIHLTGQPYVVVGVMPEGFSYPVGTQVWAPIGLTEQQQQARGNIFLTVLARLKQDVTVEQAQAEMNALAGRLAGDFPDVNTGMGILLIPLHENIVGAARGALLLLVAAVGFVLLIACANLANLMLASSTGRHREFAVRMSLGASRNRMVRQLVTESVLLAALGGTAGLLLGKWGMGALIALSPLSTPRLSEVTLDATVLVFTALLSVLTGFLFGLAPALIATRQDPYDALKEGARGSGLGRGQHRLRASLVVAEVALVLILMTGAGLMVRSFDRLRSVDPGFETSNILSLQLFLPGNRYPDGIALREFYRSVLTGMRTIPGVEEVGLVNPPPIGPAGPMVNDLNISIEGKPEPEPGKPLVVDFTRMSPGYFSTMRIPLLRGRYFDEKDTGEAPDVAIVSEDFARKYLPAEDPIGKRVILSRRANIVAEIVGVVGDVKHNNLNRGIRPEFYVPLEQFPRGAVNIMIRTSGPQSDVFPSVQSQLWTVDKDLPTSISGPMTQAVEFTMAGTWLTTVLMFGISALSLILSAIGIYGVVSYSISQRTHEFGVRLALGARRADILSLVLAHGMSLAGLGIAIGLAGSLVLTRYLSSLLFEVSATDPATFVASSLVVTLVTLLACYLPARRASNVDPMVALRYE